MKSLMLIKSALGVGGVTISSLSVLWCEDEVPLNLLGQQWQVACKSNRKNLESLKETLSRAQKKIHVKYLSLVHYDPI